MPNRHLRLLAAIATLWAANAGAALVIDDFKDPVPGSQSLLDTRTSGTNAVGTGSSLNGVGMLAGQRDMYVVKTTGPDSATNGVGMEVGNGLLTFSSAPGHAGVGIVRWDGMTNTGFAQNTANSVNSNLTSAIGSISGNGFAVTDLAAGPDDYFMLDVLQNVGMNVTLQIFSNLGTQFSQLTVTMLPGSGQYVVPFAAFSGMPALQCAGGVQAGCADFSQITAMQMIVNFPGAPEIGARLVMRGITVGPAPSSVPEPGTLALAGLALLAATGAGRRASRTH